MTRAGQMPLADDCQASPNPLAQPLSHPRRQFVATATLLASTGALLGPARTVFAQSADGSASSPTTTPTPLLPITPFSAQRPGSALPAPWRLTTLPRVTPSRYTLTEHQGQTVLHAQADHAAASLTHPLQIDAARVRQGLRLRWRWKVDAVIDAADMHSKEGDDFAARVYVMFDLPTERLSLGERMKLAAARALYGPDIPSAALCYVIDNRNPVGTAIWSPYSRTTRVIVLRSGAQAAGRWWDESRDPNADFRQAWGFDAPSIVGLAVACDTDQTAAQAQAWFGDLRWG